MYGSKSCVAVDKIHHLRNRLHTIYADTFHNSGLLGILVWYNHPLEAILLCLKRHRQRPPDRLDAAIERQFTHYHIVFKHIALNLFGCRQNAYSYSQIIRRTHLANVGWSHIDGYLFARKLIAHLPKCRLNPLMTLLYSIIRKPYQKELHTQINAHLNCYRNCTDT